MHCQFGAAHELADRGTVITMVARIWRTQVIMTVVSAAFARAAGARAVPP